MEIKALNHIGEISPGTDLVGILADSLAEAGMLPLVQGDILVITQKIVSKAEGRFVRLDDVRPGDEAIGLAELTCKDPRLVELILSESTDVVRAHPNILITRHRLGFVMANAGIDSSNIGSGHDDEVLLLPLDADHSADRLRTGLNDRFGIVTSVVISDSCGRPWRLGVVNIAIGASGLPSLLDKRGELDRNGRPLKVTEIALGDGIATAAGLVMGEGAEGIPVALVRGMEWQGDASPAVALVRPIKDDLFR